MELEIIREQVGTPSSLHPSPPIGDRAGQSDARANAAVARVASEALRHLARRCEDLTVSVGADQTVTIVGTVEPGTTVPDVSGLAGVSAGPSRWR